jgi:hypothetical protein
MNSGGLSVAKRDETHGGQKLESNPEGLNPSIGNLAVSVRPFQGRVSSTISSPRMARRARTIRGYSSPSGTQEFLHLSPFSKGDAASFAAGGLRWLVANPL